MNQNDNNNQNMNNNPDNGAKTFTQDEVNRIVSERLARDRDKRAADLDEREKVVKARELAVMAAEKLAAAGLPKDLTTVLKYDDEASLDAAITQLSHLQGFSNGQNTPDGGKKTYIEHRLPEPSEYESPVDPIREAFRLHNE